MKESRAYTCVNCIRTFPYLKIWHERYKDHGLTIIGVHSPEFDFEKVSANVKAAVERHGLEYPVAQDNDKKTWDAYDNNYRPSKYLVGVDGRIRFQHFGEGEYLQTKNEITFGNYIEGL